MKYLVNSKPASFTVGANPPNFDNIASFDLAGRLIGLFRTEPGSPEPANYRRGFDNRVIRLAKDAQLTNKLVQRLDDDARDEVIDHSYRMAADALKAADGLTDEHRALLQNAVAKGPDGLRADADTFRSIYGSVPILPPDQYRALVVQVTRGCPFNTCKFCTFYRDRDFRISGPDDFAAHLQQVRDFLGPSLR